MKISQRLPWFLVCLLLFGYSASAAASRWEDAFYSPAIRPATDETASLPSYEITYQGRLMEPGSNQPKPDGGYNFRFRLYNQETGGTPLWVEIQTVDVQNGFFTARLGQVTPLNFTDFNGQDLWLGVKVGGDPELNPRQQLGYAPYALNSVMLGGLFANQYAVKGTVISAEKIIYTEPRTHFISIPGSAFKPRDSTLDHYAASSNSGTYITSANGSASDQMDAPVYLPDGAYIKAVTAYFRDNSFFYDLEVKLYRHPNLQGYMEMAVIQSLGNSPNTRSESTQSVNFRTVDNSSNAYTVRANVPGAEWGNLGSLITINGIVIEYTLSEAP